MSNIRIIKKNGTYIYQYLIKDEKGKRCFVSKSGYKTQKAAQKAAELSYKEYIDKENYIGHKEIKVRNLNITSKLINLLIITSTAGAVLLTVHSENKMLAGIKEKFQSPKQYTNIEAILGKEINVSDCNFSNIHIILRTSKQTQSTSNVIKNQLNNLNVSNEVITKADNLSRKINKSLTKHSNKNIVLINLEYHIEYSKEYDTVIRGDGKNNYSYPSDALIACIKTSAKEYNLRSTVRAGEPTGRGWRRPSSLEEYLMSNNLQDSITQLTISTPESITEDEITRNNVASFVVDGIIRWASLPVNKRYADVYHIANYGETIGYVSRLYHTPYEYIQNNSDINIYKQPQVGDMLVVGYIPKSADNNVRVNNPNITDDENKIIITENYYTVQEGDTLTSIANKYKVDISTITTLSKDPNNIKVGEVLCIPKSNYYLVNKKSNLSEEKVLSKQI